MTECLIMIIKPCTSQSCGRSAHFIHRWVYFMCIMLLLPCLLLICGCGGKKEPDNVSAEPKTGGVVNRAADKEYMKSLGSHQAKITAVARQRDELNQRMKSVAGAVKSELGESVSKEEFKAALAQNAEWQSLLKHQSEINDKASNTLEEARSIIRERILREERENAAAETRK
jgi:hypothetical protein